MNVPNHLLPTRHTTTLPICIGMKKNPYTRPRRPDLLTPLAPPKTPPTHLPHTTHNPNSPLHHRRPKPHAPTPQPQVPSRSPIHRHTYISHARYITGKSRGWMEERAGCGPHAHMHTPTHLPACLPACWEELRYVESTTPHRLAVPEPASYGSYIYVCQGANGRGAEVWVCACSMNG